MPNELNREIKSWLLWALVFGVLAGIAGCLIVKTAFGQSNKTFSQRNRVFVSPEASVTLADSGDGRTDVLLTDVADGTVTDAIVSVFYRKRAPGIAGELLLSHAVTCPAFRNAATGCSPLVPLAPSAVEFVRVKLLREVQIFDIKTANGPGEE